MTQWTPVTGQIDVRHDREVAIVTLDRPEKLNALTVEMRRELAAAIRAFGDGTGGRGIVLTGTGRAFTAGEDLSRTVEEARDGFDSVLELFHDITRALLTTKVPTIAAINGLAVGGGSEITLCCDARLGSPQAAFFLPENAIGLTISNASSYLLPRLLRGGAATRLVLDARRIEAQEALALGLLDEIVGAEALVSTAVDLALRWTTEPETTAAHLELLRPDMETIEAAFRRETAAGLRVWESGATARGIERFWAARDGGREPSPDKGGEGVRRDSA
jgi:enoyl-CoA hydratase/carnithine racemase